MKLDVAAIKPIFTVAGMLVLAIAVAKLLPGVDFSVGAAPMTLAAVGAALVYSGK